MSQSSLLIGPPSSFQGHILFEVAFAHANSSPVIVLVNLETEVGTAREQYTRWCQARETTPSENLHVVLGTWRCATIAALLDTIDEQVPKQILDDQKLIIVRDLSTGNSVDPDSQWLPLAKELSRALHCKVITAAHWGGRNRVPQEELSQYPVDELLRVELGFELKVKVIPATGEPLIYQGKQHANLAITFDLEPEKEHSNV